MAVPQAADTSTASTVAPSMPVPELDQLSVNEEYGIRAYFPRGAVVCEARSWEHPLGFYTFIGEPRACGHPFDPPVARFVQAYAGYNANFATSAKDHLPCPDGRLPDVVSVDLRDLVLQDMISFTCASMREMGRIVVGVSAMGGGPNIEPTTERIQYYAVLSTRAEHLDEDLAFFRAFVRRLRFVPGE